MNAKQIFKDIAREWIAVNKEIDRMSDHKFKRMGSVKAGASDLADGWMRYGLSCGQVMDTLRDNKNTLEALKKVAIGNTVTVAGPSGIVVYTRIA